jgi:hypothetical protein
MVSDQVSSKNRDGLSGNVSSVRSHNANRLYDIKVSIGLDRPESVGPTSHLPL